MSDKINSYRTTETGNRPWGNWTVIDAGSSFVVKRIVVKAGEKLSLQRHQWRAEHWIVVGGFAEISLDGAESTLRENESVFIPIGTVHRLANPGPSDLVVIE